MDIYKKILDICRFKQPARCWFDYPPTYLLSEKINFTDIKRSVRKLVNSKEEFGLYVNIPFCKSRCLYCMYYSEPILKQDKNRVLDRYLDALETEINLLNIDFKKRNLKHLYIGGGTPLLLSKKQLFRFFNIINGNFIFDKNSQFVIEGRPKNFIGKRLEILKENNINRVTAGIQSFNNRTLREMGRDYNVKDIYIAFDKIRSSGIKYINADIIVGLPKETEKDHKNTIDHLLKLKPDSISCTPMLYGGRVRIKEKDRLSDKTINRYYKFFDKTFRRNNYLPIGDKEGIYLKGGEKNANNKLLFGNLRCSAYILGVGSGAVSYLPNLRYCADRVSSYTDALKKKNSPNYYGMFLDKDDVIRQYLILQLYLFHKIKIVEFNKRFKVNLMKVYNKEISGLVKNNVVEINPNKKLLVLTRKNKKLKPFLYNMLKFIFKQDYIDRLIKETCNEDNKN